MIPIFEYMIWRTNPCSKNVVLLAWFNVYSELFMIFNLTDRIGIYEQQTEMSTFWRFENNPSFFFGRQTHNNSGNYKDLDICTGESITHLTTITATSLKMASAPLWAESRSQRGVQWERYRSPYSRKKRAFICCWCSIPYIYIHSARQVRFSGGQGSFIQDFVSIK